MKKFIASMLTIVMVLCMGTSALAASGTTKAAQGSPAYNVNKESQNTEPGSEFKRESNGKQYDIRRNYVQSSVIGNGSKAETQPADQEAASIASRSARSATMDSGSVSAIRSRYATMPTGGGEYIYNPLWWNIPTTVYRANCYGYALNRVSNDVLNLNAGYEFQPGFTTGKELSALTEEEIFKAVQADMKNLNRTIRKSTFEEVPGKNEYKIALVIAKDLDYHWYRQNKDGLWSHKPGLTKVSNKDASGKYITDPKTCNRHYDYSDYSIWGGYYIVSR